MAGTRPCGVSSEQQTLASVHNVLIMPAIYVLTACRLCRPAYSRLVAVSKMTSIARNCIWTILRAKLSSRIGSANIAAIESKPLKIRSASCGMIGSFFSASDCIRVTSNGIASTISFRMAESTGPSHPSPSTRLTLLLHFGFSRHMHRLDSSYSAPLVLCP